MNTRTVVAWVLGVSIATAIAADDAAAPWTTGLPRVEATKTEVGPGQYLWGSALLLAVPDKFQDYWPDYGYRWSNAAYIELCGAMANATDTAGESLGRVRLVAESGDKAERLVGVELRPATKRSEEEAQRTAKSQDAGTNFTMEQLCALLENDAGRQRIETMVKLMAGTGIDLLKTGKWHRQTMQVDEEPDTKMAEYLLLWMGSGVHEGVDVADKVSWSAKGKPVVIWNYPSVAKLHKGYGKGTEAVIAFHEEPGYVLTKTWGVQDVGAFEQAMSFEVSKGVVDGSFLPNAESADSDVEIGILGVWANVAKYQQMLNTTDLKLWLVTENAIPAGSLKPEIRVGEKK